MSCEFDVEVDANYLWHLANLRYRGKKLTDEEQMIFDREHEKARQRRAKVEKLLEGMLWIDDGDKNVKSSD